MKITVEYANVKFTIESNIETIDEWITVFKKILYAMEFSENTINQYLGE